MEYNILITGGSGYLGGTLLNQLKSADLPKYHKLFAFVRSDAQAEAVKQYAAEPLQFDMQDETSVRNTILKNRLNVVFFLVDAISSSSQGSFVKALAELSKATGQDVHFLHASSPPCVLVFPDADSTLIARSRPVERRRSLTMPELQLIVFFSTMTPTFTRFRSLSGPLSQ
jgi:nucleoside-diphosphate-sugar epimerase